MKKAHTFPVKVIVILECMVQFTGNYAELQETRPVDRSDLCSKDAELTIHIVNEFVRSTSPPTEPMKVASALDKVVSRSGCDDTWISFSLIRLTAEELGFSDFTSEKSWAIIKKANEEHLQSRVQAEPSRACELYEQAVDLRPDDQATRFEFGKALALSRREEEAIKQFRLVAMGPDTAIKESAVFATATLLTGTFRFIQALETYELLVAMKPESEVYWHFIAETLSKSVSNTSSHSSDILHRCQQSLHTALRLFREHHIFSHVLRKHVHAQELPAHLRGVQSIEDVIRRYSMLEQEMRRKPGARYFVVTAGDEGWGNRMLVLASALLFCLETQRLLVLEWPSHPPWEDEIAQPPFSWKADGGGSKPWAALEEACRAGEGNLSLRCGGQLHKGKCGCDMEAVIAGRAGHWTYDLDHAVVRLVNPLPLYTTWGKRLLRCGPAHNCSVPLDPGDPPVPHGGPRVVWLVGLGSFLTALDRAGVGAAGWAGSLCRTRDVLAAAGCVLRHVVRPSAGIARDVAGLLAEARGGAVVAAGVRRATHAAGGHGEVSAGQKIDGYAYLSPLVGEQTLTACIRLQALSLSLSRGTRGGEGSHVWVLLLTDDPEAAGRVQELLRLPGEDKVHVLRYRGAAGEAPWRRALVEWFALAAGRAEAAVLTGGSTFALTAASAGLASHHALVASDATPAACSLTPLDRLLPELVPSWAA